MVGSETEIRVRYAETDMMGIVHHGSYVPWLECGRIDLLDSIGCPYRELEEEGIRLPVVEMNIRYRSAARFDDRILIRTEVREPPRGRIVIHYVLHRGKDRIVEASTVHAFVNSRGKPVRPSPRLIKAFQQGFPDSPEG